MKNITTLWLIGLLLLPASSMAWTPDSFQIYCGSPAYRGKSLGSGAGKLAYYAGASNRNDKDYPAEDGGCPASGRVALASGYLTEILRAVKQMGFASPAPSRLGPVIRELDASGKETSRHVRFYAEPADHKPPTFASALTPCNAGREPAVKDRISFTRLNADRIDNLPTPTLYYILAHELMHVVQNAQRFRNSKSTDDCKSIPGWFVEGVASAVGWELTRKKFGEPALSLRSAHHYYGLRYYNLPLGNTFNAHKDAGYRSSSLWRFLVERYAGGDFSLIAKMSKRPDFKSGTDDWVNWLDRSLQLEPQIKKPFYLVYPEFLTEFTAWGKSRFPKIKESRWLTEGFAGCRKVTLDPTGNTTQSVELPLFVQAGQCLFVDVNLNPSAHPWATLKFHVRSSDKQLLDALHIGNAYTGGGKPANCYHDSRPANRSVSCLLKPQAVTLPAAASADGIARHARLWRGQRLVANGKTLRNLYTVSYVPPKPSDRDVTESNRKRFIKIDLEIGLDVAKLSSGNKFGNKPGGKSAEKSGGGKRAAAANPGGVADDQGGYPVGGDGPPSLANMDFGKILTAEGGGPNLMKMMQKQGGALRSFAFASGQLDSGEGEPRLLPDLNLLVLLANKQGLKFGETGEFPATVSGGLGLEAGDTIIPAPGVDPPATITVKEFNDRQLRLSVAGTYCRLADLDIAQKRCRSPHTFTAEMHKPFGWMYSPQVELTSVDTPGMAFYREHTLDRMGAAGIPGFNDLLKNLPNTDFKKLAPPQPASSAESAGAAAPQCRCDCEEYAEVKKSTENYAGRLQAMLAGGGAAISEAEGAAMAGKSQCMDQCGLKYHQLGCFDR